MTVTAFMPERLHVRLNPTKTILQPVDRGIDFVGHVIKPWRRRARRRTVAHAVQRIEALPVADLHTIGNSYFGLLRQSPASHTDRTRIARALLKRGKCVNGQLTRTFK